MGVIIGLAVVVVFIGFCVLVAIGGIVGGFIDDRIDYSHDRSDYRELVLKDEYKPRREKPETYVDARSVHVHHHEHKT